MKRSSLLSASCLAIIVSLNMAGAAHAAEAPPMPASITANQPKMPGIEKMAPADPTKDLASPNAVPPVIIKAPPPMALPTPMPAPNVPMAPGWTPPDASADPSKVPNAPPPSAVHNPAKADKVATDSSPSTKAFINSTVNMHQNMMIDFSGNADVDFVKGMIPHHDGAIEMAKIELQYGKDPEIKRLAEQIIKAQTNEIEFMNRWLAKRGR